MQLLYVAVTPQSGLWRMQKIPQLSRQPFGFVSELFAYPPEQRSPQLAPFGTQPYWRVWLPLQS